MMWFVGEGFSGWGWFGGVGMIIIWFAIAALIVWGVITLTKNNRNITESRAIEIAKERYTRGEITKDEYDQIKKNL